MADPALRFRLLGRRQEGNEDLERGFDGGGGGSERLWG